MIKNGESGLKIDCGKPTVNPMQEIVSGLEKWLFAKISLF
jgi:hypothetical protein